MRLPYDIAGSLALHGALVALVVLWTPVLKQNELINTSLPIDIITIDEFTRLVEDTAQPKQVPEAQPEIAARLEAAPEVAAPEPVTPIDALPELEAQPEEAETPAPVAAPEESRFRVSQPAPLSRPQLKPKPLLDIGQVRALLNKTPDAPAREQVDQPEPETAGAARLTLSEIDAFRAQMQRCWSPPSGARDGDDLVVRVRLSLTPAGRISAGPVVVNRAQLDDPFFRAAAESVLRAIRRCQPFSMPSEKYASWRDIELTFDPTIMLGS